MTDSGSFNADLGINMQFNVDGAGLVEMAKTIKEISKGKDLQRYWKDVESATDSAAKAIERYNKNTQSKGLAENLLKQINALKAITNKENLSDIFPNMEINFDELIESAKKLAPKINSEFSTSNFSQAFKTFDLLKDKGIELGDTFRKLADYANQVDENFKLRKENMDLKELFGDQDIEKLKGNLAEIQKLRNEAEETFNNFLNINKIERTDSWGDEKFSEYFNEIRNGSLTATEAIAKFKTEYAYLLEENFKSNNNTFGIEQLQAFSTKLDSVFHQVEETSNKINDIISNGVIAKSVQNLSEDTFLTDSQRSMFGNLLQDEESLKSITALFQRLVDESNQAKNTELFNSEQFSKIESLFEKIESSLSSIKSVLVDVGDGEELSPLLSTINNVESAIDKLSSSFKGIGLNMNIDFGSDKEMESKAEAKISNALQAYQRLFDHIKFSSAGGSIINQKFFDFDINQYDTAMSKLQAYIKFIDDIRKEAKEQFNGKDVLYEDTDKTYWNKASAAKGQMKRVFNEMKAASDTSPLENLFGKTNFTEVLNQLTAIVSKLDEISVSANRFSDVFKDGLNVNASVEEIDKLTNRVKELESELAKVKSVGGVESNISSGDYTSQVKVSDTVTDQIVANEKKKQEAYKATADSVIYHAGVISKLNKAETNGRFYGSNRGTGYFGTGHYFVDSNTKHELDDNSNYSSLPYTSIDISKYDNLFKATSDEVADALHSFLKNLTRFTQGSDSFDVSELFSQFQKVFGETTMDMQEFDSKLQSLKSYMQKSSMDDRGDSVSTQFMKSLGYGGVDTRGTKYADTRYGTVIYDLKEESVLQANITDELQKQGQMLEKIDYKKGQVFDSSEDNRIQAILDQQAKSKAFEVEFEKLYDVNKFKSIESELDSVNQKISENENTINKCKHSIETAEEDARRFAKEIAEMFDDEMPSDDQIKQEAEENRQDYKERISELEQENQLLNERRTELQQNIQAEAELIKSARERATAIVEDQMKDSIQTDNQADIKSEATAMEQVEAATNDAVQAKKDFATANEGVQNSVDDSKSPLQLEAELMEQIAKSAREAADAKKEFVEANKLVEKSADDSNSKLPSGHSENAEPANVRKYKRKDNATPAKDTGNHDNEVVVNNKKELGKVLKQLQSEIIASIDESTSFVKEVTDFYDSQNNLVKTQTKIGDNNGSMSTHTTSYSKDANGKYTAWTSHIETQKITEQAKQTESSVSKALKDQVTAWKNIQSIREKIAKTKDSDEIANLQQLKKEYQQNYIEADKILKANSSLYDKELQVAKLEQIRVETNKKIADYQTSQLSGYEKQRNSYVNKLIGYTDTSKYTLDFVNRANNLKNEVDTLKFTNPQDIENLKKIDAEVNQISSDSKLLENRVVKQQSKLAEIISQMKIFKSQNTNMSGSQKADLDQIIKYAKQIQDSGQEVASEVEKIKIQFAGLKAKVNETGKTGKNFFSQIDNRLTDMNSKFVAQFLSWQDWIRYIQQGIDTIRDLDEAMTEVRKVSEGTESQYDSFQKTISSTAKEIASTNKELLNSSADFLRLGYSLDQAESLAKNATLFVNVGDGVDINAATEDMITAMKAFDIQAEDSIKIVDDYNQIGNMYALSATDIGEAMKRSASALETGNNSFEESIALITAMNEIVQNSENTGNTLKVFSLRLRGAKAELEAMSEDTDGLCESSSKLREQLQALTGVDIMLDNNTFKSTTEIVKELGSVWSKLSDSSQAATLELIAGEHFCLKFAETHFYRTHLIALIA